MLGGTGSPGGDELLTVTVVRDEHGYGMKVSGECYTRRSWCHKSTTRSSNMNSKFLKY